MTTPAPAQPEVQAPSTSAVQAPPTTSVGSRTPDVHYEDIGHTLRPTFFNSITVSHHDPDVAYLATYDGYVYKTSDGGRTWDESRLIIDPKPFYGDSGQRVYFGVHRRGAAAWDTHRPTSEPGGDVLSRSRARRGAPESTGRDQLPSNAASSSRHRSALLNMRPTQVAIDDIASTVAGRPGAAANVNFGIGLPGGAPRLQTVVRKFTYYRPAYLGMPIGAAGLNIKQTLLLRGTRPTEVRIVVIHPTNPQTVFACTMYGLYKSHDGGLNWVRVFQGINAFSRRALHLAINPVDPEQMLLATGNGVYISTDGGDNFIQSTAQGMGDGWIDWIQFNPYDPRYVFACTNYGLMRSADSGRTWDWVYFTTFPQGRIVRYVTVDPFDKRRGYIATHDGLYTTPDILTGSLEDWKRMGGLKFTGSEAWKIEACPRHKGHLWAVTNTRLIRADPYIHGFTDVGGAFIWESVDGGASWNVLYSGNTYGAMMWFELDPRDPDLLWIVWSRSLSRMRRHARAPAAADAATHQRLERTLTAYPTLPQVMTAALRFTGTHPGARLRYRRLSRIKALVPRLDASFIHYRERGYPLLHDGLFALPFRFDERLHYPLSELRVMVNWDLSDLVFNLDQTLFGRVARYQGELQGYVTISAHRCYGEIQRLRILLATDPPADLRVRLMYKLRIKELESYIDFLTGGYLTRFKKGDQPDPEATPWFDIWPDIPPKWFQGADR